MRLPTCGVNVFRAQLIAWNHKISRVICRSLATPHFPSPAVSLSLKPDLCISVGLLLYKLQHVFFKMFKWRSGFRQVFGCHRNTPWNCSWRWNYTRGLWKLKSFRVAPLRITNAVCCSGWAAGDVVIVSLPVISARQYQTSKLKFCSFKLISAIVLLLCIRSKI